MACDHHEVKEAQEHVRVFERTNSFWSSTRGLLVSALCAFGLASLCFVGAMQLRGVGRLGGFGGVLVVVGLVAFFESLKVTRTSRRVEVSDEGIRIVFPAHTVEYQWPDFSHAEIVRYLGIHIGGIMLYDRQGRRVAHFSGDYPELRALSKLIYKRVKEVQIVAPAGVRLQRNWGMVAIALTIGGLMTPGSVLFGWAAAQELLQAVRLETDGVLGEAEVKSTYEEAGRCWLVYEVQGASGEKVEKRVEMAREAWRETAEGSTVAIRYVPDTPNLSELRTGQLSGRSTILGEILFFTLWCFGFVFGLFNLGAALLHASRLELRPSPRWYRYTLQREATC